MTYNWKVIGISLTTVFIAVFGIFYIVHNIANITVLCETNKSFNFCSLSPIPVVILIALLIAGGLIMIVNITAYILLTGKTRV
jgi:hypothetical protein